MFGQIKRVRWPDVISNTDRWATTNPKSIDLQITEMNWKWIRHALKSENSIAGEALGWNP
jgi:hypothetical protein